MMDQRYKISKKIHTFAGGGKACCSVVDSFDPIMVKGQYDLKLLIGMPVLFSSERYQWFGKVNFRIICVCFTENEAECIRDLLNEADLKS